MKIKRLITVLLTACFIIPQISEVKAAETYPNLDEKITVKSYRAVKSIKQGKLPMRKNAMHFLQREEIWTRPL